MTSILKGISLKNLKTIITELTANNQVVFRYVNRPNCLPGKNPADLTAQKEQEHLGRQQVKVETINTVLRNCIPVYEHRNYAYLPSGKDSRRGYCASVIPPSDGQLFVQPVKYPACKIDGLIEYFDTDELKAVKTTYRCLLTARQRHLDIIKKSQQSKKHERSWGKLQKDKTFTRNAKQKILEAGAVVDRHVGKKNSYMLTLTVPGSGWDVYDQISRWSGYLINRLTQIIRRIEAKGVPVHWFFVWEHQKRGALHMHWCIAVPNDWKAANLVCLELRAKWFALLEELSVKTMTDLFKKRGFSGTWRHSPEIWKADIARVKKSVGAYFSKYVSKNANNQFSNSRRRAYEKRKSDINPDMADSARVYSLSPTRYWGCSMRVKRLCAEYRVSVSFNVASAREGSLLCEIIYEWIDYLSLGCQKVSRYFKKVAPDTGFIYCKGWEVKAWFKESVMPQILNLYRVLRDNRAVFRDAVDGVLCMDAILLPF